MREREEENERDDRETERKRETERDRETPWGCVRQLGALILVTAALAPITAIS
jgi:hypothetical protein